MIILPALLLSSSPNFAQINKCVIKNDTALNERLINIIATQKKCIPLKFISPYEINPPVIIKKNKGLETDSVRQRIDTVMYTDKKLQKPII